MRSASFPLVLAIVLGFTGEAAAESFVVKHDYTLEFSNCRYGLREYVSETSGRTWTVFKVGEISFDVPFTAMQGLVGLCFFAALLILVPLLLVVRWKRRRAAEP